MAEDAAKIVLGAIIEKAVTPVVDAIVRQFGYLFCYSSNIRNLRTSAAQLEKSRNDAEIFFKEQKRNNEETSQSSVGWLEDVNGVIKKAEDVKEATTNLNGCLNLKDRYVLGKKSTKLVAEIRTLQNKAPKGSSTSIVLPAGSLQGALANYASMRYKTRMQTAEEVMNALEDRAISVIGICGLGGVGKTTLVHEVRERVLKKNLFEEVAMTSVSQNQDVFKIQGDLAEMLGLTSIKDEKNVIARADQLYKRLTNGNKVLVILDDVWTDIKLKDVGIPIGTDHMECKVLITSRQEDVCSGIQMNIKVKVLPKEEARAMFRETAGDCVDRDNLQDIANEIADSCGGLPIALLTLSRALSNKNRRAWVEALTRLKEGGGTSIYGMEREVYQSIKLSYDFLAKEKQEEAQLLLMLCSQHVEDAEIELEKLARYCLSLGLFEGVNEVARARNRVYTLTELLKSCFLLQRVDVGKMNEWEYEKVKVHDVVRDVCLSIVSREKEERYKVYMHIWKQGDDAGLATRKLDYQKLKLLMQVPLCRDDISSIISFLEQTQELRILESSRKIFDPQSSQRFSPSSAPQFLTNLRMLSLEGIYIHPGVMSEFTKLKKLEILSFSGSLLFSFPHQIRELSNLKLLDLRCRYNNGKKVIPIPMGFLTNLTKLEVLYMGYHHFSGAPYIGEDDMEIESCPGHIQELDTLTNLTTLQVDLWDPMQLLDLKNFQFENLEGFFFGSVGKLTSYVFESGSYPLLMKRIWLKEVGMKWVVGDRIEFLLRNTLSLYLEDIQDWTDPSIMKEFVSLKELEMTKCNQLEYIISYGDGVDDVTHSRGGSCGSNAFKNLEMLRIRAMMNVRELCQNGFLPAGSLHQLKLLKIHSVPKMRHLWLSPIDPLCLVNLKVVEIYDCGALKCIIPHSAVKCLSKLEKLDVMKCVMLKGIVSKIGEETDTERGEKLEKTNDLLVHFPKLTDVAIVGSPNLLGFYNLDDGRGQSFFNPLVMLPSIVNLEVHHIQQVKQIMGGKMLDIPSSAACDWLNNLQIVDVRGCDSLESVFDFEPKEIMDEDANLVTLRKLQSLKLSRLPNLTHIFCSRMRDVFTPELRSIYVNRCDNLVSFSASSFIKLQENLRELTLKRCKAIKALLYFEGFEAVREDAGDILCKLEKLKLIQLPNLEYIFRLVPEEIHAFQNLSLLVIIDCGSLSYLLTSTVARMLVNLEVFVLDKCKSMEEVIRMNEDCGQNKIVFRNLRVVSFMSLEKLSSFCSSELLEFDFPSLSQLYIGNCPAMTTFCCGHLTAEKLQGVYIDEDATRDDDDDDDGETDDDYIVYDDSENEDHYDEDDDGKVFWKGDVNETIHHFSSRNMVTRMESSLREDGLDDNDADEFDEDNDNDDDVGDKSAKNDFIEITQHLNVGDLREDSESLFSATSASAAAAAADDDDGVDANDLKEESSAVVSKDVNDNDLHVYGHQNIQCGNEGTSLQLTKASVTPLILSSSQPESSNLSTPAKNNRIKGGVSNELVPRTADFAGWKGHMVTRKDKDLLESVERHFPDTFDGLNFRNEATWMIALTTFCRYLSKLLAASVSDLSSEEVAQLRDMLIDLIESFKFKVDWALDRLEKVEKIRNRSPFLGELAEIERQRAPLLTKINILEADLASVRTKVKLLEADLAPLLTEVKHLEADLALAKEELGHLEMLEGSLGWDLLPSYQSG